MKLNDSNLSFYPQIQIYIFKLYNIIQSDIYFKKLNIWELGFTKYFIIDSPFKKL